MRNSIVVVALCCLGTAVTARAAHEIPFSADQIRHLGITVVRVSPASTVISTPSASVVVSFAGSISLTMRQRLCCGSGTLVVHRPGPSVSCSRKCATPGAMAESPLVR